MCDTLSDISFFSFQQWLQHFKFMSSPTVWNRQIQNESDFLLKSRFWSKFSGAQTYYPVLHTRNWVLKGSKASTVCPCTQFLRMRAGTHAHTPPPMLAGSILLAVLQFSCFNPHCHNLFPPDRCSSKNNGKCFRCKIPKFISLPSPLFYNTK